MKFITNGRIASIVPTEEDFAAFKEAGHTDAVSRDALIARYAQIPEVALIEISMEELTEATERFREDTKMELSRKSP